MNTDAIAALITQSMRPLDDDGKTACRRALAAMLPVYWTANSDFSSSQDTRAAIAARDSRGKFNQRWGGRINNEPLKEALKNCLGLRKTELDALIALVDPPAAQPTSQAS